MRIIGSASCLSMRHSKATGYHCSGFLLFVGSVVSSSTAVGRQLPKERFTVAYHPAIRRGEGLLGNGEYVCLCVFVCVGSCVGACA